MKDGHSYRDVTEHYSTLEIVRYYEQATKKEIANTRNLAIAVRIGNNATAEGFREFIETSGGEIGEANKFRQHLDLLKQKGFFTGS